MVDIIADQAVARVTLLSAVGGSFDARAAGAGSAKNYDQVLTRVMP
jgi:hypothetical protein